MDETWLKAETLRRGDTPAARLLAIFDVLHESIQRRGSASIPLFKAPPGTASRGPGVRLFIEELALEAQIADAGRFAEIWGMLLTGAVISAHAGDGDAARTARRAAEEVLTAWRRGGVE